MDFECSMISIKSEGFRWDRFRDYFPFGGIELREGNYQKLVSEALETLAEVEQKALLLSMLDAQAATFLEQVWIQNEQLEQQGKQPQFKIEGHFSSAWLQINDNLRINYGINSRNVRSAMLNLKMPETIADRIVGRKLSD